MPQQHQDDLSIADVDNLLRRIPGWHIVKDTNSPLGYRISSGAFQDDDEDSSPMSISISSVRLDLGLTPADLVSAYPDFAVAAITAALARSLNQTLARKPTAEDQAHGLVIGDKTRGKCRSMAKVASANFLVYPPEQVLKKL